jgi:hypothetical protein
MEETRREGYLLEVSLCRKKSYQEFTMPKAIAVALSSPTPELCKFQKGYQVMVIFK